MAGQFIFDGLSIERYDHFVGETDYPTFSLLNELGIGHMLIWGPTSMDSFSESGFLTLIVLKTVDYEDYSFYSVEFKKVIEMDYVPDHSHRDLVVWRRR